MKKLLSILLILAAALTSASCGSSDGAANIVDSVIEMNAVPATAESEVIEPSEDYIFSCISSRMLNFNDFYKINLGEAVNACVKNYKVEYSTLDEDPKMYFRKSDAQKIFSKYKLSSIYYYEIAGDLVLNPDIPYYTDHQTVAYGILVFDDKGKLTEEEKCAQSFFAITEDFNTSVILYITNQNHY